MTIEDYIQKQRDITYLKVSREIQEVKRKYLLFLYNLSVKFL
jgi:hypothetical protein